MAAADNEKIVIIIYCLYEVFYCDKKVNYKNDRP